MLRHRPNFSGRRWWDETCHNYLLSHATILRFMPLKNLDLPGPWPIFWLCHQIVSNGITPNILPLRRVTLTLPQLRGPLVLLPDRVFLSSRPPLRGTGFPEFDPFLEWHVSVSWAAKEMQMIRHDHISTDDPRVGFAPCIQNHGHRILAVEDALSTVRANRDRNDV